MPLAGRYGTPNTGSSPNSVEREPLDHQSYVEDAFVNKTSFNPQTYAEEFKLLQRYISGSRITVTYFLLSTPTAGLQRATTIDPSSVRSSVQTSYTEIKNFEIVVQEKGFQSEFNQDSKETKITGSALLYPGMKPRIGDLFLTPIGDSTFGVFQIMDVTRLTYRQGTNHKITFFLREYASDDRVLAIRQSVTKTVWFDKETYLGDATTLLKEESYQYLKTLRQMRLLLIRYYYNTFYDKKISSIASPSGIYDPYLVHYLTAKISILDSIKRPLQLYPGMQNYDNSLWARLTDVTNRTLIGLQANYNVMQYRVSRWDISITSLANRTLIVLDNPNRQAMEANLTTSSGFSNETVPPTRGDIYGGYSVPLKSLELISSEQGYVLSPNFYTGDKTSMTPFEFIIYVIICDRKLIQIKDFIECYLVKYSELTYDEQYYSIPLYLWIIDIAIDSISAADSFMT